MQTITTIGLDIAKSVFQVHRVGGQVVIRRQLKLRSVLAFFQKLPGRALQTTRRACGVSEIAPAAGVMLRLGGRTAPNAEPVDPAIRTTH